MKLKCGHEHSKECVGVTYWDAINAAAAAQFLGSPTFADEVSHRIVTSCFRHAIAAMLDAGEITIEWLVDAVGTELCSIDAARARGEDTVGDRQGIETFFRRMWGMTQ